MDVFIKSSGRPYYLERCIASLYLNLKGHYRITVLDDGTDHRYLARIKARFSEVIIRFSPSAAAKRTATEVHCNGGDGRFPKVIPFKFWTDEIRKGSDYFLLMEEDGWLTGPVDLVLIEGSMRRHDVIITKLFWGNAEVLVSGRRIGESTELELLAPNLPGTPLWILKPLLRNTLKVRSLLLRLKALPTDHLLPYYNLYTVASAIYLKEYWLYCLQDAGDSVNEPLQLLRAAMFRKQHPSTVTAKTITQRANTTYITSTFNTLQGIHFDMVRLNRELTEAWLRGDIDSMANYPNDFQSGYLANAIALPERGDFSQQRWSEWISVFQKEYGDLGIETGPDR